MRRTKTKPKKKDKRFYIVKKYNSVRGMGYAFIINGDSYSEGTGWYPTEYRASLAAIRYMKKGYLT